MVWLSLYQPSKALNCSDGMFWKKFMVNSTGGLIPDQDKKRRYQSRGS